VVEWLAQTLSSFVESHLLGGDLVQLIAGQPGIAVLLDSRRLVTAHDSWPHCRHWQQVGSM
jgi:hypothetical protein